jgi:hypothetical protein
MVAPSALPARWPDRRGPRPLLPKNSRSAPAARRCAGLNPAGPRATPCGKGIGGVIAIHHRRIATPSATVARKDRDDIDTAAGRHDAGIRHKAGRRLDADEVVEGGGHAARTGGVGAQRKAAQPRRDRHRRARRGAAGDIILVEDGARRAIGLRVPLRPVANWSRLVLPMTMAPRAQVAQRGWRPSRADRRRPGRLRWSAGLRRRYCP